MVGRLIAAGANVEKATTDNGSTPLPIFAAHGGHDMVVGQLIAAGADANKANTNGVTPRSIAWRLGYSVLWPSKDSV